MSLRSAIPVLLSLLSFCSSASAGTADAMAKWADECQKLLMLPTEERPRYIRAQGFSIVSEPFADLREMVRLQIDAEYDDLNLRENAYQERLKAVLTEIQTGEVQAFGSPQNELVFLGNLTLSTSIKKTVPFCQAWGPGWLTVDAVLSVLDRFQPSLKNVHKPHQGKNISFVAVDFSNGTFDGRAVVHARRFVEDGVTKPGSETWAITLHRNSE